MNNVVPKNRTVATLRWIARISGLVFAAFFLLMFIGEGLEGMSRAHEANPIAFRALIGLVAVFLYLLGLILAWKWEGFGGIAAIVFIVVFAVAVPDAPIPMYAIMAFPAILFIICWLMSRSPKEASVESS
jgi:hypothetical protein